MSKKILKFSCKGSRDLFTGELEKNSFAIKADTEVEVEAAYPEKTDQVNEAMYRLACRVADAEWSMKQMKAEAGYYQQAFAGHMDGHLPPIKSAEQMKRCLASMGLDQEYSVAPKMIYASSSTIDKDGNLLVGLAK